MAYELIETIEVGSGGASSIEFTSIPQDGTDLLLVLSARSDSASIDRLARVFFNSDTGSNYSVVELEGTGSGAFTNSFTGQTFGRLGNVNADTSTSNTFGNLQIYVSNYTSSTDKSFSSECIAENNATTASQILTANKYTSTSAITTMSVDAFSNFLEHTTASLYKITAA